jgi:hypothetical protein
MQVPLWQASFWVHALPSLQEVPLASAGFEHVPVDGLQVPATWHWSLATHVTATVPTHVPAWQAYASHMLLPVHAVPSAAAGLEHAPVVGSHVPAAWQASLAVQVTSDCGVHTPN